MKYDFLPFIQLVEDVSGGNIKLKGSEYLASGEIPIIDQGKEFISGYTNNLDAKFKGQLPVVVFGDHTRIFKYVDFNFAMGADGVKVLKLSEKLDPKFGFHYFNNCYIPDTGYNRHFKYLKVIEIPLPPLPEQKRIAAILDKADALRQKNKQLLAAYDGLLQATFLELFGDPVTNPKGWEKKPFNKCGHFTSGGTPDKSIKRHWDGKFPWVSPKDMKVSIIYDSLDHISESVFNETNLKRIPPNHLLIVVRGMILAHSFPLAINAVEVAINQDMKAISPINNLNILYFQACLNSLKREVISLMSTSGHGTKKFDKESMKRLYVPIPPIALQNQFAQIVENIEAQKTILKQSIQESEDLFNGLVQKAFNGELS